MKPYINKEFVFNKQTYILSLNTKTLTFTLPLRPYYNYYVNGHIEDGNVYFISDVPVPESVVSDFSEKLKDFIKEIHLSIKLQTK